MYVAVVNNVVYSKAYTTLKRVCEAVDVPYRAACSGKRHFIRDNHFIFIAEVELVKVPKKRNKTSFK